MGRTDSVEADRGSGGRSAYPLGYQRGAHEWMAGRDAAEWAGFLIPYLQKGMRLLDCGCGPGSITLGLAEVVAPGEAVGLDVEPKQVERARTLAQDLGLANARFEVGSIYELPFPDASFDAAFAANVLEHLKDPLRALRGSRRVLRPGGVVGVRDPDASTHRIQPQTAEVQEAMDLYSRVREETASPCYAPRQRALLRQAGFVPGEASAFAECESTPEEIRPASRLALDFLILAASQGWIDAARSEVLRAHLVAWPDQPDALRVITHFAAVGRVPET